MEDEQELCEPNDDNGHGHDLSEVSHGVWGCCDCPYKTGWGLSVDAETVVIR